MGLDRLHQIGSSSVVQEEEPLPYSPQGRGTEFVGSGVTLGHPVGQADSHVVHGQIGKQVHDLLVQR